MAGSGFRRLIVMRHAKTEAFAGSDRARRLTRRGVRDAVEAGRWLAQQHVVPEFVLVSPASRARETYDCLCDGLREEPDMRTIEELYDADVDDAIDLCSVVPSDTQCAMVIGHNPTMAELAQALQARPGEDFAPHLATSGLAVIDVDSEWDDLAPHVGTLALWHVPRG